MAGNVRRLDTISFGPTIQALTSSIQLFNDLRNGVNTTTNEVTNLSNWRGRGRDAFLDDSNKIRRNLQDINDILREMRDALQQAHNNYNSTDRNMAGNFRG